MATREELLRIKNAGRIAYPTNVDEMLRYVTISELGEEAWKALNKGDKEGTRNFLRQIITIGRGNE